MVALFRGSYHRSVGHPFIKTQDLDIRPGPRPRPRQDKSRPRQGQDKTKSKTRKTTGQDQMQRLSWPSFHQDILEKTRTLCVGGGGISSFFSGGLGVLQVEVSKLILLHIEMSKLIQHTNRGSYKLGCPSLFNIPTTSLKKKLDKL